jgi:hypothetical protein
VIVVACTLTSGGLLLAVRYIVWPASPETVWDCLTFGPPLVIFALTCGVTLQIGLMGVDFADSAREWYSRVAAKLLVLNLIWLGAFILVAFTPIYVLWLFQNHLAIGGSGVVAWLLTTFAGFQAGKSPSTGGTPPANTATPPAQNVVVDAIARVAPPIAVAVLLVAISTLSFEVIDKVWPMPQPVSTAVTHSQATAPGLWDVLLHPPREHRALQLAPKQVGLVAIGAGILFALAWMLSARFNINEFSMNHFYKNRLVRCYLGASKGANRRANPFTGFDPKDDIPLQDLAPGPNHDAPYPILNCTLNLNAGSELAWQERKATSFIFTPLYCGYKPEHPDSHGRGYVPTSQFLQNGGPHIGLATAISGAAANPNWGYHTSPVTAFLMTIFNVRLGWWVGNTSHTRHPTWKTPGPSIALKYLFYEMIGLTDETCRYLNLSDGGHFENLGLYELIRRKCRFIIASDGEQDEEYVFESLGGAIRKARIDFGAEIDLLPKRIVIKDGGSAVHCALGTITYNNGATGQLLYIKSSLTGDEPYDVTQYQKAHRAFPQESTLDQFFTESQFESYRALGRHIVEKIFEQAGLPPKDLIQLEETFDRLAQIWLPPASAAAGAFTKHAQAYSQFLQRLGKDKDLRFLDAELLPGSSPARRPDKDSEAMRKAKLLVTDLIQLMEDVYVDLNLDDPAQADHPQNRGWIILFTHWTKPGTLLSGLWQQLGTTYGVGFRRFYDKLPNI